MDEEQLKKLAIFSITLMIVVGICGWVINSGSYVKTTSNMDIETEIQHENTSKDIHQILAGIVNSIEEEDNESTDIIQVASTEDIAKKLGNHYIKIKKPEQNQSNITLVDEYEQKKIAILFQDIQSEEQDVHMDTDSISWVTDGKEYFYETDGTEHTGTVREITIKNNLEETSNTQGVFEKMLEIANTGRKALPKETQYVIELKLNEVYAYTLYMDQEYLYINLQPLRECYDHIIVVDAGHGGKDTGSYAAFGELTEKEYNLAIVKKLREYLSKEEKIKVFYTRLVDTEVSLESRVSLANSLKADLFLSVHCNSNDETPEANGIEVLYQNQGEVKEVSKKFAKIILNHLIEETGRRKRSILKGNNIYIIRNAKVPVALAEVGFLNNTDDLLFLQSEEGQSTVAEGLYKGILEMLSE